MAPLMYQYVNSYSSSTPPFITHSCSYNQCNIHHPSFRQLSFKFSINPLQNKTNFNQRHFCEKSASIYHNYFSIRKDYIKNKIPMKKKMKQANSQALTLGRVDWSVSCCWMRMQRMMMWRMRRGGR